MEDFEKQLKSVTKSYKELSLSPQLSEKLGALQTQARENLSRVRVFVFRYLSHGRIVSGFLIVPQNIMRPLPVIIFNRGGTGDIGLITAGRLITDIAELATWGYVVIGSQYTGNSLSEGRDEWGGQDLEAILDLHRIMDSLEVADTSRMSMLGVSRGGAMTLLASRRVQWLQSICIVSGVTNLRRFARRRQDIRDMFHSMFPVHYAQELSKRSAVDWPNEIPLIPTLIAHGKNDATVSYFDSVELYRKLHHQHRSDLKLSLYESADHHLFSSNAFRHELRQWLRITLT